MPYKNYPEDEILGRVIFVFVVVVTVVVLIVTKGGSAALIMPERDGEPIFSQEVSGEPIFDPEWYGPDHVETLGLDIIAVVPDISELSFDISIITPEATILVTDDGEMIFKVAGKEILRMTKEGDYVIKGKKTRNRWKIAREVTKFIKGFNEVIK